MTTLQYLRDHGITTTEIIDLKRNDPKGMATLKKWAIEQAATEGINFDK